MFRNVWAEKRLIESQIAPRSDAHASSNGVSTVTMGPYIDIQAAVQRAVLS
jgi:hypothetical protein